MTRARRAAELLAAAAFIALIGAVDVWTGHELSPAAIYVVVVVWASWRGGRLAAASASLMSVAVGLVADHLLSEPFLHFATSYSHPAVPWWNGLTRLCVYLLVGMTIASLRSTVRARDEKAKQLQAALDTVRTLEGLLPICAWCKKMRDDSREESWVSFEQYVATHTDAELTHGICPDCAAKMRASAHRSS